MLGTCSFFAACSSSDNKDQPGNNLAGAGGGGSGSGGKGSAGRSSSGAGASGTSGGTGGSAQGGSSGVGEGGAHVAEAGAAGANTTGGAGAGGDGSQAGAAGVAGAPDVPTCASSANTDLDKDGFTPSQGDCNDCDANVNPGAFEVPGNGTDDDCNSKIDEVTSCDADLALDSANAYDAARALELCQSTTALTKTWGVLSAKFVRANGATASAGINTGILSQFGANLSPTTGSKLLALSSGAARLPGDTGYATSLHTTGAGTAPAGFPTTDSCASGTDIVDDIALEVTLRVPSNAKAFRFRGNFYVADFPGYVGSEFSDQFVALVSPPPQGSLSGDVAIDTNYAPVSLNTASFNVCVPENKSAFASSCSGNPCPSAPDPYCPLGASQLSGTGFETGAATGWQTWTTAVVPGATLSIRFAIWDRSDATGDSTVLLDGFEWVPR